MSGQAVKHKQLKRILIRNMLLNTTGIVLALGGVAWTIHHFMRYAYYEITNDAVVDQYISPVNVRATGYIREIRFTEHQQVKAGDTLLILDDREYEIKLKDAQAALMEAKAGAEVLASSIETARNNIAIAEAHIAENRSKCWKLKQDYKRYANLLKEESVSQQQYEQVKADYETACAHEEALLRQKAYAESQCAELQKKVGSAQAQILRKEAEVEMAQLNLSYTVVTAPYDGHMGRRTLENGQLVQNGQILSNIIRGNNKWITANYKETQIAHIYIGQEVLVKVDALKNKVFRGRVSAISEATGSKYSLVPTDNSAGNFVKIQQRIPVRIELENVPEADMEQLRTGMMVETEAKLR